MDVTPAVEPLVTVRRAARLFGIGRHVLFQAAERGELAVFDPGGWARVRLSDVQAWLERTRRVPRETA
jgi:excisionase family DNA binding protein